jgi:hypothetical protein
MFLLAEGRLSFKSKHPARGLSGSAGDIHLCPFHQQVAVVLARDAIVQRSALWQRRGAPAIVVASICGSSVQWIVARGAAKNLHFSQVRDFARFPHGACFPNLGHFIACFCPPRANFGSITETRQILSSFAASLW